MWFDAEMTVPWNLNTVKIDPTSGNVVVDLGIPFKKTDIYLKILTKSGSYYKRKLTLAVCGSEELVVNGSVSLTFNYS